ncbi:hypothetical protein [Streptomyces sp. NBC_01294]|uniref:hypothetical protein n=1 Tax=Streptomyces sp. NBC_01294 TaxID=2903815 RepID=UPI003FA3C3F2
MTHAPLAGRPVPPTPAWATRQTHAARRHTLTGHTDVVRAVAVVEGPDGPLAITAGDDRTAIVWDVVSGARRHTLSGHNGDVRAVAVVNGPKGPLAITASNHGTAIVWDAKSGRDVSRTHLPHGGIQVAAAGTGFMLAYGREVAYFACPCPCPCPCP